MTFLSSNAKGAALIASLSLLAACSGESQEQSGNDVQQLSQSGIKVSGSGSMLTSFKPSRAIRIRERSARAVNGSGASCVLGANVVYQIVSMSTNMAKSRVSGGELFVTLRAPVNAENCTLPAGSEYQRVSGYINVADVTFSANAPSGSGPSGSSGGSSSAPQGGSSSASDLNKAKGEALARDIQKYVIGFTSQCYAYVADTLERQGVLSRSDWSALGIGTAHAADFATWANANPQTLRSELRLKRIYPRLNEVPVGSILVWNRGACGFSGASGHIEIVVAPGQACSDGCQGIDTSCDVRGVSIYYPVK